MLENEKFEATLPPESPGLVDIVVGNTSTGPCKRLPSPAVEFLRDRLSDIEGLCTSKMTPQCGKPRADQLTINGISGLRTQLTVARCLVTMCIGVWLSGQAKIAWKPSIRML